MLEKGKAEKQSAQVQFAAYKQFYHDTTVEKKRAIAEANDMIEVSETDIEKYAARYHRPVRRYQGGDTSWRSRER